MTDKKLTDAEIVKALECCIKSSHFGECFENKCPMASEKGCKVGKETLYPYALDLINRLQNDVIAREQEYEDMLHQRNSVEKCLKTAKAEAYKEYIEKVKSELRNIAKIEWQDNYYYLVGTAFFDNLLKEFET